MMATIATILISPLMLTDLPLRLLWFLLAGFIMGFATSYLWEVLYARGRRWREEIERAVERQQADRYAPPAAFVPAREAPSTLADVRAHQDDFSSLGASAASAEPPQDFGPVNVYESPDFYLDSETSGPLSDWSTLTHEAPVIANRSVPQDDFTHLEGLRSPHAEALYRAGVNSFEQLAGMMPYEVTALLLHEAEVDEAEVNEEETRHWLIQALDIAQERRARVAEHAPLDPPPSA